MDNELEYSHIVDQMKSRMEFDNDFDDKPIYIRHKVQSCSNWTIPGLTTNESQEGNWSIPALTTNESQEGNYPNKLIHNSRNREPDTKQKSAK